MRSHAAAALRRGRVLVPRAAAAALRPLSTRGDWRPVAAPVHSTAQLQQRRYSAAAADADDSGSYAMADFFRVEGTRLTATYHTLMNDDSGDMVTLVPCPNLAPPSFYNGLREILVTGGYDAVFWGELMGGGRSVPRLTASTDGEVTKITDCIAPTWDFDDSPKVHDLHDPKGLVTLLLVPITGLSKFARGKATESLTKVTSVSKEEGLSNVAVLHDPLVLPLIATELKSRGFSRLTTTDVQYSDSDTVDGNRVLKQVSEAMKRNIRAAPIAEQQTAFRVFALWSAVVLLTYMTFSLYSRLSAQPQQLPPPQQGFYYPPPPPMYAHPMQGQQGYYPPPIPQGAMAYPPPPPPAMWGMPPQGVAPSAPAAPAAAGAADVQ